MIKRTRFKLKSLDNPKAKSLNEAKEIKRKQDLTKGFNRVKNITDSLANAAMFKDEQSADYAEGRGKVILVEQKLATGGDVNRTGYGGWERTGTKPAEVSMEMNYKPTPVSWNPWEGSLENGVFELGPNEMYRDGVAEGTYTYEKLKTVEKWSFKGDDGKTTKYALSRGVLTVIEE